MTLLLFTWTAKLATQTNIAIPRVILCNCPFQGGSFDEILFFVSLVLVSVSVL